MQVVVADPRWLWLVVIAVALSLLLFARETLLGFNRPRLDDAGSVQPLWRLADRLPRVGPEPTAREPPPRRGPGDHPPVRPGHLPGRNPLAPLRGVSDRLLGRDPDEFGSLSAPAKVRVMLQQPGPTYVKIGQMISSRADALPQDWREELDKLQSTVPPFPGSTRRRSSAPSWAHRPKPCSRRRARAVRCRQAGPGAPGDHARRPRGGVKVQRPGRPGEGAGRPGEHGGPRPPGRAARSRGADHEPASLIRVREGVLAELDYGVEAYHGSAPGRGITGLEASTCPGCLGAQLPRGW